MEVLSHIFTLGMFILIMALGLAPLGMILRTPTDSAETDRVESDELASAGSGTGEEKGD